MEDEVVKRLTEEVIGVWDNAVKLMYEDGQEPTPDRLRAAGFTQSSGSEALFVYGTGPVRLQYVDQDGGKWDMFFKSGEYCFGFADLKTMAAVRAWMKAVDAANGGGA